MITTLEEFKEFLGITAGEKDTEMLRVLKASEKFLETKTNRGFTSGSRTQKIDGKGQEELWLQELPISSITSITIDEVEQDKTEYQYDADTGEFWHENLINFTKGKKNIVIVYVAGWTTENAPEDLKQAIYSVAAATWKRRGSEGISNESTGDYSVTYETGKNMLPESIQEIADLYIVPNV